MNIEKLFTEVEHLELYKVTGVLTEDQNKLLAKFAAGHLPTGYRKQEIDQAVQDIRDASIEACIQIFGEAELEAKPENKDWPWFDLSVDEGRSNTSSQTFTESSGVVAYLSEFMVQAAQEGGRILFSNLPVNDVGEQEKLFPEIRPGEMLIASRKNGHEFEISKIESGLRFTLMTHIDAK
jgi:hypothetical protein